MSRTNEGGVMPRWRALAGALLAGATLLCGMGATGIARADEPTGNDTRIESTTKSGDSGDALKGLKAEGSTDGKSITVTWDAVANAKGYKVYRAKSAYAKDADFKLVSGDQPLTDTTFTDTNLDADGKYANYYKVATVNADGDESLTDSTASLDQDLFGDHTYVFAPTDDMDQVDKVLGDLFTKQNDIMTDAQFQSEHWQVYFKPGDYTSPSDPNKMLSNVNVGFYTEVNGLGKLPTDTLISNISTGNYLNTSADAGQYEEAKGNATCNFWRAVMNIGVKDTEPKGQDGKPTQHNTRGHAGNTKFLPGDPRNKQINDSWRPDYLNWGVAQAAPMRRVWTNRPVAYDWNYGWASGGYTADSKFEGNDDGKSAGTVSGQQFYTRNSEMTGAAYGTTLNNFLQGVTGATNVKALNDENSTVLKDGDGNRMGVSNWGFGDAVKDDKGNVTSYNQQVLTSVDSTEKIAEKPFLYLDGNGEYQVFVPGFRTDAKGVSWGADKENDGMGVGTSIPLSEFYIADPSDDQFAEHVNKAIEDGKNVYLRPGIYHAKSPIVVNRDDVVMLGTGMATIIPDNEDAALKIGDNAKKGVRIAGLIFDAGKHSTYLVKVGDTENNAGDADDPVELQDIFYRIGGTTDSTTSADYGIVINTKNTVTDHFWIWRADHGAGVGWPNDKGDKWNYSKSGMVVNGDNVIAYGLFNEHHEEYDTLWNGENGKTFFYQNEKCYDPVSQDVWKSHNGTVNGYSAYKVANNVEKHYAVGLGIYNVFIYTGPEAKHDNQDGSDPTDPNQHTGDGTTPMQLDNAVEVPNSPNVVIENVATQSFADLKDPDKNKQAVRKFNSIINGVGAPVGSGPNITSWSRKFLLKYQSNADGKTGTATYGKNPGLTNTENGKDNTSNFGKFIGTDANATVCQLGEEIKDFDKLPQLKEQIAAAEKLTKAADYQQYTAESRKALEAALQKAQELESTISGYSTDYLKYDAKASDGNDIVPDTKALSDAAAALTKGSTPVSITFRDVTSKTPHTNDIQWLADNGVSTGWKQADGTYEFRPMNTVIRADMAAFLYRLAGKPAFDPATVDNPFADVKPGDSHYKEIMWLYEEGITTGFKDKKTGVRTFGGDRAVVRQDMAAFLHKLAIKQGKDVSGQGGVTFVDVNDGTPHADDIRWLARTGVTTGWKQADGTRQFRGMNVVVRQDMAAFLHKMDANVLNPAK